MAKRKPQPNDPLTAREHEVARLVIKGESNKLIAKALYVSEHTAKYHVANIVIKLDAQTRVDAAVKYALAQRQAA